MRSKATTEEDSSLVYGAYSKNTSGTYSKIFNLQRKLYFKAKQEPVFRFYSLYGHVYGLDLLREAFKRVAKNNGAPGVDGVSIDEIVNGKGGVKRYLEILSKELQEKRYSPQPVKRGYILKPNGKKRPLGIPTVRDRIVQAAVLLVIEPIFEADFLDISYGFRPKRSAHDALVEVKRNLDLGYEEVYDADLSSYFDTIPHENLMRCLEKRISDRHILKLIRMFIKAVIKEEDGSLNKPIVGTPQGGVISPLLANIYLHWFEKLFYSKQGPGNWAKARMVRYADDFVIFARFVDHRIKDWVATLVEGRMGLTINVEKTSIVNLAKGDSLDFLSYTFRRVLSQDGSSRFTVLTPSVGAAKSFRSEIRLFCNKTGSSMSLDYAIDALNRKIRGWSLYFSLGYYRKTHRDAMHYTRLSLIRMCKRKSQRPLKCPEGMTWYKLFHSKYGLINL